MAPDLSATAVDWSGWTAAALTMLTFVCRDMKRLRLLALGANAAFIGYGVMAALTPVLVLHLVLAPINAWRLVELRRGRGAASPAAGVSRGACAGGLPAADSQRSPAGAKATTASCAMADKTCRRLTWRDGMPRRGWRRGRRFAAFRAPHQRST